MRRLIVVLALLVASNVFAQDPSVTATLSSTTCPGTGCVTLTNLSARSTASISVSGAWTGSLIVLIGTEVDNLEVVNVLRPQSSAVSTAILNNGVYVIPMAGMTVVRVKADTLSSGSASVKLSAGQGDLLSSTSVIDGLRIIGSVSSSILDSNGDPVNPSNVELQSAGNASLASIDGKVTAINTGAVNVSSSVLPTGASTAANQSTGNSSLASIDGKITAVNTGAVVVSSSALPTGAATAANQTTSNTSLSSIDTKTPSLVSGRVPVDGSGVTQPVSGTVGVSGSVAVTGPLTDAQIRATPLPVSGTVTSNAGTGTFAVSAASLPLPSGAATSANQTTTNASLTSIDDKLTNSVSTSGSITTSLGGPLTLSNVQGYSTAAISVDGTWTVGGIGISAWCTVAGSFLHPCPTMKSDGTVTAAGAIVPIIANGTMVMDIAGAEQVVIFGQTGSGTANFIVTATKGSSPKFPFSTQAVSASALPLPTGASTSSLQTTGNSSLSSIDGKTPALGQAAMAASSPVVIASNQSAVPVSGTVTANQGTAAAAANRWPVTVSDGTNSMPTMDAAARPGFQKITDGTNTMPTADVASRAQFGKVTDGTNTAAVKAASTAVSSTDPSLVVQVSPNSSVSTNLAQLNGSAINTGNGSTLSTGTQRVTISDDSTGKVKIGGSFSATWAIDANGVGPVAADATTPSRNARVYSSTSTQNLVFGVSNVATCNAGGSGTYYYEGCIFILSGTYGAGSMTFQSGGLDRMAYRMDATSQGWATTFALAANEPAQFYFPMPNTGDVPQMVSGHTSGTLVVKTYSAVSPLVPTSAANNGTANASTMRVTVASDSTGNIATIGTSVTPGTAATNLGKAEDAPHTSGDVGIMAMGIRKDTNAQTTNADSDYTPGSFDAYGAQFTRVDHPNRIRCTVTVSTATTIQAVGTSCAAPGAGLSIYITDIEFSASAAGIAADAFPTLKYGTGGTCGTGTTVFWGALTAAAIRAEKSFTTPIKIPANNEICWITSTAGSKFLVITGYIAP